MGILIQQTFHTLIYTGLENVTDYLNPTIQITSHIKPKNDKLSKHLEPGHGCFVEHR